LARIRTVKPEFWTDSKTGSLSDRATKLFIGMLCFSDDYGVLEDDMAALKAKIFPYYPGTPVKVIGKSLDELMETGLVIRFEWGGKAYLWIRNFEKHQRVDRPGKPMIDGFDSAKLLESLNSTNPRECSPCNGVVREGKGKEGNGEEGKGKEYRAEQPSPDKPAKASASNLTDQEFLEHLKTSPAYEGIDIDQELARMDAWLLTPKGRRRKKTRQFVVNWLNRCDKPIGASNGTHKPDYQTARTKAGGIAVNADHFAGVTVRFDEDTDSNTPG